MSLIFQTMRRLDADPEGQEGHGVAFPSRAGPLSGRTVPITTRRIAVAAAIALGLVAAGFGAVLGVHHLDARLQPPGAQAGTVQVRPVAAVQTEAHPPGAVDEHVAPTQPPVAGEPVPAAEVRTAQPQAAPLEQVDSIIAAGEEETQHRNDDPPAAGNVKSLVVVSDERPAGRTELEAALVQQQQLQRARRAALERSARIDRLVAQLEAAVAQPDQGGDRVETLLAELDRIKGADSLYLDKMRAYWLFQQGRLDEARTLLERVAATDETDLEAGLNLVFIDMRTGEVPSAMERLVRLRKAHPENLRVADLIRRLQ